MLAARRWFAHVVIAALFGVAGGVAVGVSVEPSAANAATLRATHGWSAAGS